MSSQSDQSLTLSTLAPAPGSRHRRKRLGKGESSGKGKTCGRGGKGQSARSGWSQKLGFEGGQMPLYRRLPKVGFRSRKKTTGVNDFTLVSIARLAQSGLSGEVSLEKLVEAGLISSVRHRVKLVGGCDISTKLVVQVHAATTSARAAIEKAGGEIQLLA